MPRRSERPTTPPLFDVLQYAKEYDAASRTVRPMAVDPMSGEPADVQAGPGGALEGQGVPSPPEPRSETRLATHPMMGATLSDEAWAISMLGAPVVVMPDEALRRLPLDHRIGFLLSLLDGTIDLATVVEVAAMPQAKVLRIVRDLFDRGIVAFR